MTDFDAKPLAGRTALITGASGGIGGALALRLAAAGADLALGYSSHPEDAERTADEVRALGGKAVTLHGDLADPGTPVAMVDRAAERLGALDILIPNAGMGVRADWQDVDPELWDATMAVNTRAPFLMAQRVLPAMIDSGWGRILFVSSIAAHTGGIVGPHYAASKAALHGLTHHLAARVVASGVTVNTIAPALIGDTRMFPADPDDPGKPPAPIPVGRLGQPEEVASMALAMLTNAYLTSKVITLDGGIYPS